MNNLENLLDSFDKEEKEEDIFRQELGDEKIVFVHDSYHKRYGKVYDFSDEEYQILTRLIEQSTIPPGSYQFLASIKGFNVSEDDLTTEDINRHRKFLEEDLESLEPDLVIPLGNLAFKTLTKKSGILGKRGKEFHIKLESGNLIPVVPTLHPFSLYAEPKLRTLFLQDINNAYTKFILKENKFDGSPYVLINGDLSKFDVLMDDVMLSDAVAFDVETGGLDFKKHGLFTIGFSVAEKEAFVVAINHKESEWSPKELKHIKSRISSLMKAPKITKIAHNLKFDYKFLRNWGLEEFNNMEDTQIIHSLVDENLPHGLMDIVKQYFPKELEKF